MTHPTDDEIIKRCKAAGIRWLPPAPDAGEGDFPGAFDLVTMVEMRALLATQGEPVAWALGNPRYVHATNIFPAHEFTPDAERADEWTALYDHPAPSALLAEQARTEPDLAPGVMRCARCKFRLHRINLNVNVGTVTAGDNKTEPCPNGCGPLWPVTWKEEAEEAMAVAEGLCDRAVAAEKELADLRERLGPRAAQPLKAEQAKDAAEDAELLEWLEEKHYALHPIKEDQGDDTYTLWWQVTDKDKSISGHPLGNIRAAIRAARAAERKA